MAIKVSTKYLILGVFLSLLMALSGGWYLGYSKQKKVAETALNDVKKEITRLTIELCDQEFNVTKVEQELATEKELRKRDIFEKEELRKLGLKQANEITKLKLRIDTLLDAVNNSGGVVVIHDTITQEPKNYVKLPFIVTKNDQWLSLKDSTDIKGKSFVSLKMALSVDVVSGIDKKTKKHTVSVLTDNPYIQTIGIASYKTDTGKPKSWGIGVQFGYGLNKNFELSPYLGVGISRNIIRF